MSERDDELITQYAPAYYTRFLHRMAERHGNVDRVEDGVFFFADGASTDTKPLSLGERWAKEGEFIDQW